MNQIKTVIFDVGMVLVDFCWKAYLEELYTDPAQVEELGKCIFLDPLWEERDLGLMSEAEYVDRFCVRYPEHETEIRRVFSEIYRATREYPASAAWLQSIHDQGYQVLILSNFAEAGFTYIEQHYDFFRYVDGIVVSYRERTAKPEPKIYQILLERYGRRAEECIFVDDRPANLQPAAELGIHTVLASSHEAAVQELREKFGIE